jgi:hypothetical protein
MLSVALSLVSGCSDKPSPAAVPAPSQQSTSTSSKAPMAPPESAFTESLPDVLKGELALRGSACNMERIDGQLFGSAPQKVRVGAAIKLAGWVVDGPNASVPEAVFIRAETQDKHRVWHAPIGLTVDRSDVSGERGKSQSMLRSGYEAVIRTDALPAGTYRLLAAFSTKTEKALCDNGRTIVID